jgi:tripartite-type tricarboxylate transporter receptor subunit TctC
MAKTIRRRTVIAAGIAGSALTNPIGWGPMAWAKGSYPIDRTMRIVVPFAAGGTADSLGRVVAQILADSMSTPFVVENWTGAGGNVAAEIVAKARPDGQTLLLGTVGIAVTNQLIYKNIQYDSGWSFTPIALVAEVPNVVVVHPTFPARTVGEFVELCRERGPYQVSYGSPGVGAAGHLAMEYLQCQAGIRLKHVAYRSRSAMIRDLLAGNIPVAMDNLPAYQSHIRTGALRALGVSSTRRWFATPDVPSIAEQGYPGFEAALWWYVAAPAGMRLELVNKLSDDIVKGIGSEATVKKIRQTGAWERPGNTEDLARHIAAERTKWKQVIDAARLQPP